MLKRATALIFASVSLIGWLSCGKNVSRFLYASVPGADQIVVYREDPNSGILTALTTSPTAAGPAVAAVTRGDHDLVIIAVGRNKLKK